MIRIHLDDTHVLAMGRKNADANLPIEVRVFVNEKFVGELLMPTFEAWSAWHDTWELLAAQQRWPKKETT